jgi:hypothetical protein
MAKPDYFRIDGQTMVAFPGERRQSAQPEDLVGRFEGSRPVSSNKAAGRSVMTDTPKP